MFKNRTVRDLLVLTLVKGVAITLVYYACFAAYRGQSVDTVSHLLGPPGPVPGLNAAAR